MTIIHKIKQQDELIKTLQSRLSKIMQEAEQLRKERDELATAIIKIHEDQEGDYCFLKFISHPQYILAKKVSERNGNA